MIPLSVVLGGKKRWNSIKNFITGVEKYLIKYSAAFLSLLIFRWFLTNLIKSLKYLWDGEFVWKSSYECVWLFPFQQWSALKPLPGHLVSLNSLSLMQKEHMLKIQSRKVLRQNFLPDFSLLVGTSGSFLGKSEFSGDKSHSLLIL